MVQERLDRFVLLTVENETLLTLPKESIIDSFARSSSHLSSVSYSSIARKNDSDNFEVNYILRD